MSGGDQRGDGLGGPGPIVARLRKLNPEPQREPLLGIERERSVDGFLRSLVFAGAHPRQGEVRDLRRVLRRSGHGRSRRLRVTRPGRRRELSAVPCESGRESGAEVPIDILRRHAERVFHDLGRSLALPPQLQHATDLRHAPTLRDESDHLSGRVIRRRHVIHVLGVGEGAVHVRDLGQLPRSRASYRSASYSRRHSGLATSVSYSASPSVNHRGTRLFES